MTDQINREFKELWDDTAVKVRAYIFCICRNKNQVDDLTQECFLRALRSWDKFDSKGSRQGWLFTIARRTCIDWFRKKTGNGHVSLDAIDELAQPACVDDNSDRIEIVWENIRQLQPEYSEILYLRFAGGLNYAEMAKTLDVPIGTVRSRLHRGLKALKSKFQGQKYGT